MQTRFENSQPDALAQFSHEIRTPLYGVVGTASLLAATSLSEEQRFYVETLQEATKNLMRLTSEVLDFCSHQSHSKESEPTGFSLETLSRHVLALFGGLARNKGLALNLAWDPLIREELFGDSESLRQVCQNLLSNALKYTAKGFVTLRWQVLQETNTQQILRCEVEDSGPGIPFEAQKKLFRPYYRVKALSSAAAEGTGLGLSICRNLIEKNHGRMGVTDSSRGGSIFWFEIPLKKCHKIGLSSAFELVKAETKLSEAHMDLSFFKILVAEDNPVNQKLLSKMLEKMGIEFKIVESGQQALDALEDQRFDFVIMDCYMSPMSGFETAQKIRESRQLFSQIPIIAFTASSSELDQIRWQQAGMNDGLLKPVTQEQLREKVSLWARNVYKNLPILDPVSIQKIRAVDDEEQSLLLALMDIYSNTTREEVETLGNLIAENSMDLARKKAHKLKSSAAQLGAWRFEKFCEMLEYGEPLPQEKAQKLYTQLHQEYSQSRQRLSEECQKISQSVDVSV